jgi:5-methylcytosine-specific restriction endonuclease McrA
MSIEEFDASLFGLGVLCRRGHDYQGTGKSLRRLSRHHKTGLGNCLECDILNKRQDYKKLIERRHQNGEVIRGCKCAPCAAEWQRRKQLSIQKHREYTKEWFDRNPEYIKQRYHANPEKYRRKAREERLKHPDRHKERWLSYYVKNRDRMCERSRQYRKTENGKLCKRIAHSRRKLRLRTTHRRNYKTSEVKQRIQAFDNACAYCGKPGNITLDHFIPISLGGTDTLWNLIPACNRCNSSKNASLAQTWYPKQPFFNRDRWEKILSVLGKNESNVNQLPLL